jgi:peptidoglycan/xylan/chitin deacetylase (PgdA/CDA1 family)
MKNKKKIILSKLFSKYFIKSENGRIILTYHSLNKNINNLTTNIYQLDPFFFIDHINHIKKKNFISRNFADLYNSENGILLTFDDGYKNFLKYGMEKILEYNLNSIIFICPKLVKENNPNYLNEEDLKEISQYKNIEIGSHSYDHVNLTKLNNKDLIYQLESSKKWLEDFLSVNINKISYPFGAYNRQIIDVAKNLFYKKAFTTRFDFFHKNYDDFQIPRVDIWRNDNKEIFSLKLKGKWNWMRYFNKYNYIK